ncbi:MAG: aminopeptidase P family protein [Gemmatimonadales bacterium]|nr:aminopeptidase P family protein [Gemmatimonadales bacterium]MDQ3427594.1 aminopeptidase P family protein [Gemmatimonadota bacterium]
MNARWIAALAAGVLAATRPGPPSLAAEPVPVERLAARRAALFDRLGTGMAIIRSAEVRSMAVHHPQDSDYREDNNFFYLTGLEAPGATLLLVARDSEADQAILYIRDRAELSRLTGIRDIRPSAGSEAEIRSLVLAARSPARMGGLYLQREQQTAGAWDRVEVEDLEPGMAALRLVKDGEELARLRRATDITTEALREAMQAARPGMWEYELEATIEYAFRRRGAERVGFPSIVGSGPNSTTLHYDKGRRQTRPGDLVVMDVGAEFGYYTSDVTRTIPISGRFTPRQRQLYDLVLATQQTAIDSVRPGTTLGELNRVARNYMRRHSGKLCGRSTCDRFFVHGLSHWLGMDVHDVGSFATPLAPGMVLTVEPGIYLVDEEVGIRIEDVVLVTEAGREVLSNAAPRTADGVEREMLGG